MHIVFLLLFFIIGKTAFMGYHININTECNVYVSKMVWYDLVIV